MKKIIRWRITVGIVVCLAACLSISGAAIGAEIAPETFASDGYHLVLDDGQATLVQYDGEETVLRIPAQIEGYPLTAIGDGAFSACSGLTSVVIASGVASIGDGAFAGCAQLISITIPVSVTAIEKNAFADCANATLLLYEDSYAAQYAQESMLRHAFLADTQTLASGDYVYTLTEGQATIAQYGGDDAELTIPEQLDGYPVTAIGADAFAGSDMLAAVSIPRSVTAIHGNVFARCQRLASIEVSADNPVYESMDGALFDAGEKMLMTYPIGRDDKFYMIPEATGGIGERAFSGSTKLTVVAIPDSVASIGEDAFAGCDNLVLLANEDGYLAKYAQEKKVRYALIKEPKVTPAPHPIVGTLTAAADEPTDAEPADVEIADAEIADAEVANAEIADAQIADVEIADIEIEIADAETEPALIAKEDFMYAIVEGAAIITQYTGDAEELVIPEELDGYRVTTIEGGAFAGLGSLTDVTIPQYVTAINSGAFASCYNLVSLNVQEDNPVFVSEDGVLFDAVQQALVAYPAGRDESAYTIPESTKSIGSGAFAGCTSLESVDVPESVDFIGDYAFAWCAKLTDVTIPDSVASIDASVFVGCDSLSLPEGSFALQSGEENTADYAYAESAAPDSEEQPFFISGEYGCILTDGQITILNYIGSEVDVVIPDQIEGYPVTVLGDRAFSGRSELQTVTVPGSVTSIGQFAFAECENLTLYVMVGSDAAQYALENSLRHAMIAPSGENADVEQPTQAPTTASTATTTTEEPEEEEAKVQTESGGNLLLRRTPDTSSNKNIVTTMPNGAIVTVVSRDGSWAKVLYTNRNGVQYEGYAYQKYLLSIH